MVEVKTLKICLAASGGGHVRQLLDTNPAWKDCDHFFVTEETALGKSVAADHRTHFVAHVAWGQARLGTPFRMIANGLANCWQALKIVLRERPDVVVTTGAGSMAFMALWARLSGANIVLIDSYARFDGPSLFARLAGPLAHVRIAQSAGCAAKWPGALLFDPFRMIEGERPAKDDLLFATAGATLPFPRLTAWVESARDHGLLPAHTIIQVGEAARHPSGLEAYDTLPFPKVLEILDRANVVVCHGGTGSLITALRAGCHVIAIPRRFSLGEHYDDHQFEIAQAFARRGLVQLPETEDQFLEALRNVAGREPVMATTDPAQLCEWLHRWLAELAMQDGRRQTANGRN